MAIGTAAAIIGGSVLSGVIGATSANKQAKAQQKGIDTATEEQKRQFDITTGQLTEAQAENVAAITAGATQSAAAQQEGFGRQQRQLGPFAGAGREALQEQQFLLGQGTQEQQDQALSQIETSGSKFVREQAEKRALRTAAATGSFGGGGVKAELERLRAGFDAQNFNTRFAQLGDLRTGGQQAATNIGQGALSTGTNVGQTKFNAAQLIGSGAINTAARQGQFGQNFATNVSNLAVQGGNARASGIAGQTQALQSGLGGVFSGAAQGGLFSPTPPPSINQFANFPPP